MASSAHDARIARRAIIAATCGNALEFYDFVTYAYFAIQIGHTFFPSTSSFLSLMGSLATFGAGFAARPIGAWVIGGYADRVGRKKGMFLSMLLMGAGIFALALTPGYATIGIAAPIIAICARLCQGFALGGEVGAATTYMLEAVPPERRGWASSWQNSSQMVAFTVGALVAFMLSLVFDDAQLSAFGWRIALLAGTLILPFALVIRSSLPDFPAHAETPMTEAEALSATPAGFWRIVILGMVIIGTGTTTTYIFLYMATFAQHTLHLPAWVGMAGDLACNGAGMVTAIIGGWLSDKVGRRPAMIWPQLGFVILILPMFAWFLGAPTVAAFVVVNLVLSGLGTMPFSAAFTAVAESLPRGMRARAFALVYTIPVTTMGGSTQPVLAWLIEVTHNPAVLAYYMMAIACTSLVAMLFLPESAPMSIRRGRARGVVPA
ncbi:MFS transporter [Novosphingobium sp.]|uniref:MFS transporter n=1 Tax=Novosphingobium sp. TaxID=1874826 RepID=UPI003B52D2C2